MKKILIILPLFSIGLVSCNGGSTPIVHNTDLINDIKLLRSSEAEFITDFSSLHYVVELKETKTSDDKRYVYSCYISYKDTKLDNFKMYTVPGSFLDNAENKNIPLIGYSTTITLAETKDATINQFNKIKLAIELDNKETTFYTSIRYDGVENKHFIKWTI